MINRKTYQLAYYLVALPLLVRIIIGFNIGMLTHANLSHLKLLESVIDWTGSFLIIGFLHVGAWILGTKVLGWKIKPGFRGKLKFIILGFVFTYLFILDKNSLTYAPSQFKILIFVKVLAVSVAVQLALYLLKVYDSIDNILFSRTQPSPSSNQTREERQVFFEFSESGKIKRVDVRLLMYVRVFDHVCVFYYLDGQQRKEWSESVSLTSIEKKYSTHLLRINRSTLVNPYYIDGILKQNGRRFVRIKGSDNERFSVSRTHQKKLERLTPEIELTV